MMLDEQNFKLVRLINNNEAELTLMRYKLTF